MIFKYNFVPESDLNTLPWVFKIEQEFDNMSVKDLWEITTDDESVQVWHTELTKITNKGAAVGLNNSRHTVFKNWLFSLLMAGSVTVVEDFDVWEDENENMKRLQFWFSGASRPSFLTYKGGREEFKVEAIPGTTKCKFTRIIAFDPAFLTRFVVGWAVYPMLNKIFCVDCPRRLEEAIRNKTLPLKKKDPVAV